jgi:hypothetical protein
LGPPQVEEEISVSVVDGYERNATFRREREPATEETHDASLIARAQDRVAGLRWSSKRLTDVAPLVRFLRAVGCDRRTQNVDPLHRGSSIWQAMIGAWDDDELVAFGRESGDVEFNALLSMIIVDPQRQDLGLSRRLIEMLMGDRPNVRFMLNSAPGDRGALRAVRVRARWSALGARPTDDGS